MTEEIPVWCAGEDWCPVTGTAKLVGKKWHPVIIHRLIDKKTLGFNDLKREVDGVSSKVLSESLKDLQENNLVKKEVISENPKRVRYKLTEKGKAMSPVIREMRNWGKKHLKDPEKQNI